MPEWYMALALAASWRFVLLQGSVAESELTCVLAIPAGRAWRLPGLVRAKDVLRLTARECQQKSRVRQGHPWPHTLSGLAHKSEVVPRQSHIDLLRSFCVGIHLAPQCRLSIPEVSAIIYGTLRNDQ